MLCGIKISVIFTDLNNNVHSFSSDEAFRWTISEDLIKLFEGSNFVNYDMEDVKLSILLTLILKYPFC